MTSGQRTRRTSARHGSEGDAAVAKPPRRASARQRRRPGKSDGSRRSWILREVWVRLKPVLEAAGNQWLVTDAKAFAEDRAREESLNSPSKSDPVKYGLKVLFGGRLSQGGDWYKANIKEPTDPRYALLWGSILGALSGGRTTALPKGGVDALFTTGAPTRADGHNTIAYRLTDFWSAERGLDPESLHVKLQSLPIAFDAVPDAPHAEPALTHAEPSPTHAVDNAAFIDNVASVDLKDDAGSQPLEDSFGGIFTLNNGLYLQDTPFPATGSPMSSLGMDDVGSLFRDPAATCLLTDTINAYNDYNVALAERDLLSCAELAAFTELSEHANIP